ncbi:MAG: putative membrane protein [Planctomycetota bacterium]
MSKTAKKKNKAPKKSFTLFFLRGLGALLPLVLTIFIFVTLIGFARTYVTTPINNTIYWSLEGNSLGWSALESLGINPYDSKFLESDELPTEPTNLKLKYEQLSTGTGKPNDSTTEVERREDFASVLRDERAERQGFFRDLDSLWIDRELLRDSVSSVVHPLIGLLLSVLVVLWLGWILTGFIGRKILAKFDQGLLAIPGVRAVYPYAKQLVEFFISENELEFDTVVALPYPNKYIYSIGFVTSQSMKSLREATGQQLVSIFIPSSPMPMTGWTIHVPREILIRLPITIDEALRITVSGGVLVPPAEFVGKGLGDDLEESREGDVNARIAKAMKDASATGPAKGHASDAGDDFPDTTPPSTN